MKTFLATMILLGAAVAALHAEAVEALPEVDPIETGTETGGIPEHDYSALEDIVILEGGRKKPLLTFARESLLTLSGRTGLRFEDGTELGALEFVASMWLGGRDWTSHPVISLDHAEVKNALDLDSEDRRHAYRDIVTAPRFGELLEELDERTSGREEPELSEFYETFSQLVQRLQRYRAIESGAALTVVPHPSDVDGSWVTFADAGRYYTEEDIRPLVEARGALILAYNPGLVPEELYRELAGDLTFASAAANFREAQRSLSPDVLPAPSRIATEVRYERGNPFRAALVLSLLSCLTMALTWHAWRRGGALLSRALGIGAVALLALGMAARVYIAGRPPVTNMYETIIWVAFGLLVFALIFEFRYRCRYYLLSATPFAALLLLIAESAPVMFEPNISPLTPVLRDNFWLTTHVLTVSISYAAFALAFALGHFILGAQILKGGKHAANRELYAYIYRALQVGVLLLAIGVTLGAVWANYSWGRFWDWDPKETWSLIALLGYLFVLHGRLAGWWSGFGFTVGAVLGFMGILMCWYGVNYVLGAGLHSYGFGSGGTGWVIGFVVFELLFVATAIVRRYAWHSTAGPPPGSGKDPIGDPANTPKLPNDAREPARV